MPKDLFTMSVVRWSTCENLAQAMAHMHGREPLDLTGKPDPDLQ
jgi:hypothetical protein